MNDTFKHKDIIIRFIEEVNETNFQWRTALERFLERETYLLDEIDYFNSSEWLGDAIKLRKGIIYVYGDTGFIEFSPVIPIIL